jgi:2-phospho-L-lactate transferase/gluconeogenesis factor (CofD/UPF0052 family)
MLSDYTNINKAKQNAYDYLGKNVKLIPSTRNGKKFMIVKPDGTKVHFGAIGYEDYTKHQDKERQKAYLNRSGKIVGNWRNDKYSPNNLSRNILWM